MTRESSVLYDLEPGVLSWAAFEACSAVAVAQATRRGEALSLLISRLVARPKGKDVPVSDGFGNAAAVLAAVILRSVRSGDTVARHGTSSFAALLPAADENAARGIADDIRDAWTAATAAGGAGGTLSQGIATLPLSGSELRLMLAGAEDALSQASSDKDRTGNVLEQLRALYRARADAAKPASLDRRDAERAAGRGSAATLDLDIPNCWHDAALFGSDPQRRCRALDLAAYIDAFPLLPFEPGIDLPAGEAAFLLRSVRYAWADTRSQPLQGRVFPLHGPWQPWVRRGGRPPLLPNGRIDQWGAGLLCLTSRQVLFGSRASLESLCLSDIREIQLVRGGLVCVPLAAGRALVLFLPDAPLAGLYLARALADGRSADASAGPSLGGAAT